MVSKHIPPHTVMIATFYIEMKVSTNVGSNYHWGRGHSEDSEGMIIASKGPRLQCWARQWQVWGVRGRIVMSLMLDWSIESSEQSVDISDYPISPLSPRFLVCLLHQLFTKGRGLSHYNTWTCYILSHDMNMLSHCNTRTCLTSHHTWHEHVIALHRY